MRGALPTGCPFFSACAALALAGSMLLGGCGGTPITAHPTEEFVDTEAARALVGLAEGEVYDRFGQPEWKLQFTDKTYLLYAAAGQVDLVWDVFLPFIVLPAEAYDDEGLGTLYCAAFEIDEAGKVASFESDWSQFYAISRYGDLQHCMRLIPRNVLLAERDRLRHKVATEGDAEAQQQLRQIFLDQDVDFYRREYLRKRLNEGDDSNDLKMQLAELGHLDPFGVLLKTKNGQPGAAGLDLCAGGKVDSIKLEKVTNDRSRIPIFDSLKNEKITCKFLLPAGQYSVSCHAALASDPWRCDRQRIAGVVTLEAGHEYQAKTLVCRMFCCRKQCMSSSTIWIEDMSTGRVILGSSDKCPPLDH